LDELTMKILLLEMLLILSIGSAFPTSSLSAESGWNEVGVRTDFQISSRYKYFRQYDVFAVYGLPWEWRGSSGWGLAPNANISLGILNGGAKTEFITSIGTAIVLNKPGPGVSADFGINANVLNRRHFANQDFGSILQFGVYIGAYYRFANNLKIGYRLQHISNGHIFYPNGTPNPGLDMHMIGLSYVF
jgi:hypothetical protein